VMIAIYHRSAIALAAQLQPDVVLMDLRSPSMMVSLPPASSTDNTLGADGSSTTTMLLWFRHTQATF